MDEEVRGLVLYSPGDSIARYLAEGNRCSLGFVFLNNEGLDCYSGCGWLVFLFFDFRAVFFPYLPGDFYSISFCYYNYLR